MAEINRDFYGVKIATAEAVKALKAEATVRLFLKGDAEPIVLESVEFHRWIIVARSNSGATFFVPHSSVAAFSST